MANTTRATVADKLTAAIDPDRQTAIDNREIIEAIAALRDEMKVELDAIRAMIKPA